MSLSPYEDLISIFLHHVAATPHQLALQMSHSALTYQQLHVQVVQWKSFLSQHLETGNVIVCLERTPRLLAVLLALQWLEMPYIPIDLKTPIKRLRIIIQDSQAKALLLDTDSFFSKTPLGCLQFHLDTVELPPFKAPCSHSYQVSPNALAYIIYTSGSTGVPKGVMVSRAALNHFLAAMSGYFLKGPAPLLLAITTLSFDIAALELYLPLWQQGAVFLSDQSEYADPARLIHLLETYPITLLQATPSMWGLLKNHHWKGKLGLVALCGGEPLPDSLAAYLLPRVDALWNMYGPTEATIWCALKQIQPNAPITIGRPLNGVTLYVMDASLTPLPPYVKGELYIGGAGLAEGYLNREALTQVQFISGAHLLEKRLYKTGDIACCTPDGEFLIFGRCDNQIKLHGHRIELEEIESILQKNDAIRECAVRLHDNHLVAYICLASTASFSQEDWLHELASYLPSYMLPRQIIPLSALPRLDNGKIDRKSLPLPSLEPAPAQGPSLLTTTETALMQSWMMVLQLPLAGLHDNFFALGGHSLAAMRIVADIAQQLHKQIAPHDLARAPTLAQLARLVDEAPPSSQPQQAPDAFTSHRHWIPLNDFQLLFWLSMFIEPSLKMVNIAGRKRLQGPLNKEALDVALRWVYETQEVFSYHVHRAFPIQKRRHKQTSFPIWEDISLEACPEETLEKTLSASFDVLYHHFPWSVREPQLRARLFYLKNDWVELQVAMPHYLSDEDSLAVFFRDLSKAYLHYCTQRTRLSVITSEAYSRYAWKQQALFQQCEVTDMLFWKTYLQDAGPALFAPQYIVRHTAQKAFNFSSYLAITESLIAKIRRFCEQHLLTFNEIISAAFALTLLKCGPDVLEFPPKLMLNLVKSTRSDEALANAIGCFLQIVPIKLDLHQKHTLLSLAKQAEQSILETSPHQHAASLTKLSTIGRVPLQKSSLKLGVIAGAIGILSRFSRWTQLTPQILQACQRLSKMDRQNHFVVNVNILSNFFATPASQATLLGKVCQPVPLHPYDLSLVEHVIEVCLLRDDHATPYVAISSNLVPTFRQQLGETLLATLEEAVSPADISHVATACVLTTEP